MLLHHKVVDKYITVKYIAINCVHIYIESQTLQTHHQHLDLERTRQTPNMRYHVRRIYHIITFLKM